MSNRKVAYDSGDFGTRNDTEVSLVRRFQMELGSTVYVLIFFSCVCFITNREQLQRILLSNSTRKSVSAFWSWQRVKWMSLITKRVSSRREITT